GMEQLPGANLHGEFGNASAQTSAALNLGNLPTCGRRLRYSKARDADSRNNHGRGGGPPGSRYVWRLSTESAAMPVAERRQGSLQLFAPRVWRTRTIPQVIVVH